MGLIRILLVISVIIAHATDFGITPYFLPSILAVKSFFIISGFFIAYVLQEKYQKKKNSFTLFISNRLYKIFPGYWIVLFCVVLFSIIQIYLSRHFYPVITFPSISLKSFFDHLPFMNPFTKIYIILSNIFIIGQDTFLFLGLNTHTGAMFYTATFWKFNPPFNFFLFIPATWVLSLELYFYLLAPWIVRRRAQTVIVLAILSLAVRMLLIHIGLRDDPWNYRFFPSELLFFLLGVLSFKLWRRYDFSHIPRFISILVLVSLVLFTIFYSNHPVVFQDVIYFAFLVIAIPCIFTLCKDMVFDRYLSEISYTLYLSHLFILTFIDNVHLPIIVSRSCSVFVYGMVFSIFLQEILLKRLYAFRQKRIVNRQ